MFAPSKPVAPRLCRRASVVLVLLLASTLVGGLVPTAQAQTLSGRSQLEIDEQPGIDQFVARYFGTDTDQSCDDACQDIETNFARPATETDGADQATGDMFVIALAPGLGAPLLADPPVALSVLGALALANAGYYLWHHVGAENRDFALRMPMAASNPDFYVWSDPENPTVAYNTFVDPIDPYPLGYVGFSNSTATMIWQTGTADCTDIAPPLAGHHGVDIFSWRWNWCWVTVRDGNGIPIRYDKVYSTAHGLRLTFPELYGLNRPSAVIPGSVPYGGTSENDPVSPEDLDNRVTSVLDGDTAEAVRCQIDHALGGDCPDPAQQHATVPGCEGVSVATCEGRIRAAGFTGDIEHETLSAQDADPDNAADEVSGLDPASGKEIEPPDTITIVKNPSTMPTWTPTEDDIADDLEQANPTTVNSTNKKRLARECAKWTDRPGSGTSSADCLLRPVFFTGNDARGPADHDISVLKTKPQLVKLNKRTTVGRRPFRCTGERPTMTDCDEYPFWSTMQWVTDDPDVSYEFVHRGQNQWQGAALGVFYNVTPRFGLPQGCDIQADDPDDWFLHIPLTKGIPVKTTWACNRPVTP